MARFVSVKIDGFSKAWINPDHVMGVSVLEEDGSIALLMSSGDMTIVAEDDAAALVDVFRARQGV